MNKTNQQNHVIKNNNNKSINLNLNGIVYSIIKRTFDFIFSLVLLIIFMPIFFITALSIKIESPGLVFVKRKRIGKCMKQFDLYKFRVMKVLPQSIDKIGGEGKILISEMGSKRCLTRFGRFLRITSIEEMPQLINIIKGEMSFVGPRPPFLYESEINGSLKLIFSMTKPGMTGLGQINTSS